MSYGARAVLQARVSWECRHFVAGVVFFGALLFSLIGLLIPARYKSTTTVARVGQFSVELPQMSEFDVSVSPALLIAILRSDTVQDELINRFDLRRVYWVSTYDKARQMLSDHTTTQMHLKSGLLSITVSDYDAQRSSAIAQAYVAELNRRIVALNTSSAHQERLFLEERLKLAKLELDHSAKDLGEFSSKNKAVDIEAQVNASIGALARVEWELIGTQSELHAREQIYTSNHIYARTLQARCAELRRQVAHLIGVLPTDAVKSAPREQFLPPIRTLPVLKQRYDDLHRNALMSEALVERLSRVSELVKIEESTESSGLRVIDPAETPEKSSGPPRLIIVVLGAIMSLCFAPILLPPVTYLSGSEQWN